MRILFCSHVPLDRRLGMAKHYLELAESFKELGWEARVAGPDEIAGTTHFDGSPLAFSPHLRTYLRRHAADNDVVEFDHAYLPFERGEFPASTLLVARCMLLHHHFLTINIPPRPRLRAKFGQRLLGWRRAQRLRAIVALADRTVRSADLTVVSNPCDAEELVRSGADAGRVAIFPLGLSRDRLRQFDAVPIATPARPVIAFVGTFDPRKGMCEFPRIVESVTLRVPDVVFRLLGTAGMISDVAGVLASFPRRLRGRLEVQPRYDPHELPALLTGCSAGVFPSHVESFGFGVLEMLAAALPVVAYDVPGPPVMLPAEYLVPRGNAEAMADRVVGLISDPARLGEARLWARNRSRAFDWESAAKATAELYQQRSADLRRMAVGAGT
jgi:glycosyltransferase involved in cell wall biosynthesis